MTHYINLEKKRLVGRNNQPIPPLQTDYSTVTDEVFTFIDSNNKIIELPASGGLYYAGSLKMNQSPSSLLWLCEDFTISGNQLTFNNIDTYTSGYMREIKKKYTEVNIEIGVSDGENKKVFLRDTALANPRVYIDGIDPHDIPIPDFATKEYVDAAVSGKQDLITSTNKLAYDLVSGAPSVPSSIIEDVTVNGSSIVQNGIAAIPLAETNSLGLMKVYQQGGFGLGVNPEHFLYVTKATLGDITKRNTTYRPITPYDLNFAVKSSLTDINHLTLTSGEQATTQAVFNVPGLNTNGKIEYSMLDNAPAIPSAVSDLVNDSGFATSSYVDEAVNEPIEIIKLVGSNANTFTISGTNKAYYIDCYSDATAHPLSCELIDGKELVWGVDINLGPSASIVYGDTFNTDECDALTANNLNRCVVRSDGKSGILKVYSTTDLANPWPKYADIWWQFSIPGADPVTGTLTLNDELFNDMPQWGEYTGDSTSQCLRYEGMGTWRLFFNGDYDYIMANKIWESNIDQSGQLAHIKITWRG